MTEDRQTAFPASEPDGAARRLRVGILGATGAVGQKFVRLLSGHPWFRVTALAASPRSAGKRYGEVVRWLEGTPLPTWASRLRVEEVGPHLPCDLAFSALDAEAASRMEPALVRAGLPVISNARSFRMEPQVPLVVPEVNPGHLGLLSGGRNGQGFLVTNPNCSTTGLVLALKPLLDAFSLERVLVTTLQAVSGAGYPGVPSMDILGNVLPHIPGEVQKLESEPKKILGTLGTRGIEEASITVGAQCNRVPVPEGHLLSVSAGFRTEPPVEEVARAFREFRSPLEGLRLPSAPERPLAFTEGEGLPQPRLQAEAGGGMTVTVGGLRPCPVLHVRFVALVHNTIRGAAGGAILNAEVLVAKGYLGGARTSRRLN